MSKRPDLIAYNKTHIRTGKDNPNYKGGKPQCIDCDKMLSSYVKKHLRCKSCENKRRYKDPKNHPMYGKSASFKRFKYKNIWMKSSWEYVTAFWLDLNSIKWQYEPTKFELKNTTYTPDFYLPEEKLFIEVKGWQRRKKYFDFCKRYKNINSILFDRESLHKYLGLSYRELNNLSIYLGL